VIGLLMRKKIVAGNWKMNLNYDEAILLADSVSNLVKENQKTNVILAPPSVYLNEIAILIRDNPMISVAAQNCSDKISGAFTGEISAAMLSSIDVSHVIIGHSERRKYFNESNSLLAEKIRVVLENNLLPIYCCGETIEERNSKKHFEIIAEQIKTGLFHLDDSKMKTCTIAYEPVWAIGTGVNATAEQAQEMHLYIRNLIKEKYGAETAKEISILYGGSVTSQNASELFSCPDVDGGLVGGASLKAEEFFSIIQTMEKRISS